MTPTIPCAICGAQKIAYRSPYCEGCRTAARSETPTPAVAAFLLDKLNEQSAPEGDCVRWTGRHNDRGYGTITAIGADLRVHRVAYAVQFGSIPAGLTIDHVRDRGCRYRDCINPAHLEPVTQRENVRRVRRPYCRNGHAQDHQHRRPGRESCYTCHLERLARRSQCEICGKSLCRGNLRRHRIVMHADAVAADEPTEVSS